MEKLTEGWVTFQRIFCKEGYIDKWMGDCINDPNNPTKHQMCLNMVTTYYRCNNGEWVNDREIGRSAIYTYLELGEVFTAQEIWDELKLKYK